jgi:hypothetical protein
MGWEPAAYIFSGTAAAARICQASVTGVLLALKRAATRSRETSSKSRCRKAMENKRRTPAYGTAMKPFDIFGSYTRAECRPSKGVYLADMG